VKRKEFLKKTGSIIAMAPLALLSCSKTIDEEINTNATPVNPSSNGNNSTTCTVSDPEEVGPFPLYNKRDTSIQHVDITEGKTGVPLNLNLQIKNVTANCAELANAQVVIWHCDKDGYYSGYNNSGYLGTQDNTSKTFCRGMGNTDAQGIVRFKTIYPGWYQGRATHIHAQIYVNGVLKLSTQFAFPEEVNTWVYNSALYKAHGQNPTKNTTDNVFRDSIERELATLTPTASNDGYDLAFIIKVAV
jgi:protocatechuate 3,4-dioxygenase beta subunit